jgi:hypothetical protein
MTNKELAIRLDRLEEKMDKMLSFRGWVLGVTTSISAGITLVATYLTGGFHRGQ